jgi:hypothetical protein
MLSAPYPRLLDAGRSAEAFNQQVLLETLGEAERVELSSATLKVRPRRSFKHLRAPVF